MHLVPSDKWPTIKNFQESLYPFKFDSLKKRGNTNQHLDCYSPLKKIKFNFEEIYVLRSVCGGR
jgi:hypothetical protein